MDLPHESQLDVLDSSVFLHSSWQIQSQNLSKAGADEEYSPNAAQPTAVGDGFYGRIKNGDHGAGYLYRLCIF